MFQETLREVMSNYFFPFLHFSNTTSNGNRSSKPTSAIVIAAAVGGSVVSIAAIIIIVVYLYKRRARVLRSYSIKRHSMTRSKHSFDHFPIFSSY